MRKFILPFMFAVLAGISLSADSTGEIKAKPVNNFKLPQYLGKWYEIARLDHWFEKDLEAVTAHYSLRTDGKIRVFNRGYSLKRKKWKEREGKAVMENDPATGLLKVSFFGPFFSPYIIFTPG